jgi:hypothetical protein
MTSLETIISILEQYKKFGWNLERVLISQSLSGILASSGENIFPGVDVISSKLDAAWFSRPAKGGGTAWELRVLDDFPFALVEVIEADVSPEERESLLSDIETKMRERRRSAPNGK